MSSLKIELLKVLETAPDSAIEQTLQYLKSILPNPSHEKQTQDEARSQWVEQLRQRRSKLSIHSTQQTVIEMRQEERF